MSTLNEYFNSHNSLSNPETSKLCDCVSQRLCIMEACGYKMKLLVKQHDARAGGTSNGWRPSPQCGLAQYLHSCVWSGAHQFRSATLLTTVGYHNTRATKTNQNNLLWARGGLGWTWQRSLRSGLRDEHTVAFSAGGIFTAECLYVYVQS